MAVNDQQFKNLGLSLGGKLLYCANSFGLDMSTDEVEASCKRTEDFKNYKPGSKSATAKVDGLMTSATGADAAVNVTSENLFDLWQNGTEMALTFGSELPGEAKYAATAFITSFSLSATFGEVGSYSTTLRVNGPFVKTINPA